MLSIAPACCSQYYTSLASLDYYLDGGEPLGVWFGNGAHALSLEGLAVIPGDLSSFFDGVSPSGQLLVQNAGKAGRQPGLDLTFSAPKCVSTLWSQLEGSDRELVQAAHQRACEAALQYFEESVELARRGRGGAQLERGGLVVAMFEHGSSRSGDPSLHTHCLLINACRREDSSWGAIDGRAVYAGKMAAGALYRTELANSLVRELGLALEPARIGFRIRGVPQPLQTEFSKRRQQIEKTLSASAQSGARASERACKLTRRAKTSVSRQRLFESWRAVGEQFGFTRQVARGLLGRVRDSVRRADADVELVARRCLDQLFESNSFISRAQIVRRVAEHCRDGRARAAQILDSVDRALRENSLTRFHDSKGREFFSTDVLLAREREVLQAAERSVSDTRHQLPRGRVHSRHTRALNAEQAKAVEHLTTRAGSVQCLTGFAGTGKTSTLKAAAAVWKAAGYSVVGCALAGKAARELEQGSGIPCETLRMTLARIEPDHAFVRKHERRQMMRALQGRRRLQLDRQRLDPKTVVVLDEASMVGTKDIHRLMALSERAGAKLVLVGDERQLPSIDAGAPFRALCKITGAAELLSIVRQQSSWMRRAVLTGPPKPSPFAMGYYRPSGPRRSHEAQAPHPRADHREAA